MKHLLTAFACLLAMSLSAQTWNPDADFDNIIGTADLLELLSVFGTEWTADYAQDPEYELAAYHVGKNSLSDCIQACAINNARIIGIDEFAMFQDSIVETLLNNALYSYPNGTLYTQTQVHTASSYHWGGSFTWHSRDVLGNYGYSDLRGQVIIEADSLDANYDNFIYTPPYSAVGLEWHLDTPYRDRQCFCTGLVPAVE